MASYEQSLVVLSVLVLYNVPHGFGNPMAVAQLVSTGVSMSAPFTGTALNRLHGEIFGSGRAVRSSDIIIFNTTPKTFILSSTTCSWGGFTSNLFPEHKIEPHTGTVYGIESSGFMSGVTCEVTYTDNKRSWEFFTLHVDNPYIGHNIESSSKSGTFSITSTLGGGNNNQVRYVLS